MIGLARRRVARFQCFDANQDAEVDRMWAVHFFISIGLKVSPLIIGSRGTRGKDRIDSMLSLYVGSIQHVQLY